MISMPNLSCSHWWEFVYAECCHDLRASNCERSKTPRHFFKCQGCLILFEKNGGPMSFLWTPHTLGLDFCTEFYISSLASVITRQCATSADIVAVEVLYPLTFQAIVRFEPLIFFYFAHSRCYYPHSTVTPFLAILHCQGSEPPYCWRVPCDRPHPHHSTPHLWTLVPEGSRHRPPPGSPGDHAGSRTWRGYGRWREERGLYW